MLRTAVSKGTLAEQTYSGVELALALITLIVFTEGLLPRLISSEGAADSSAILRYLWLPFYGLVLLGVLWQAQRIARALLLQPFLVLLTFLAVCSFLWSIDPEISQRRGLAILITGLTGIYLGVRYDWRTLLRLLGLCWLVIAIASLVSGLVSPSFAITNEVHVGAWKGMFYEKNALGGHMSRAAYLCAFLLFMDRPWRMLWLGAFGLCILLMVLSTSKTAILALILGLGVLILACIMKQSVILTLVLIWLGVVLGSALVGFIVLAPETFFGLLGREPTLTGRTDIWNSLIGYIAQRPWLGYGYGVFWLVQDGPVYWVQTDLEWDVPSAHNGWLEVALATGLLGFGLLLVNFLLTCLRAAISSVQTWSGIFALGFCLQFFLFSLSESISLQQNSIVWLSYVAFSTKLALGHRA